MPAEAMNTVCAARFTKLNATHFLHNAAASPRVMKAGLSFPTAGHFHELSRMSAGERERRGRGDYHRERLEELRQLSRRYFELGFYDSLRNIGI